MTIKKGEVIQVVDCRKGKFIGIAEQDFDPEALEFYPIALAPGQEPLRGINTDWYPGDSVPCRKGLSVIKVIKDQEIKK